MAKTEEKDRVRRADYLSLAGVSKSFGGRAILKEISFQVATGESVVLLGPSGCGKTTLLRMIAGLETPDAGEIYLDGECVAASGANLVAPHRRRIGFVFQDLALWTHFTVEGNLQFVLSSQKVPRSEQTGRVEEMLDLVRMQGFVKNYPAELSGGEQQRVAIARAFANSPKILLADEPTGNLDSKNGQHIFDLMTQLHAQNKVTLVLVTHDPILAAQAERQIVLTDGRISKDELNRRDAETPR